jgi:hypothetical protein
MCSCRDRQAFSANKRRPNLTENYEHARLAGKELLKFANDETTIAQLIDRDLRAA